MATQEEIKRKVFDNYNKLKKNQENTELEKDLKNQTKLDLGEKIFEEYYLPADENFDIDGLLKDTSIFEDRFEEKHSFPFSDKQFKEFLSLKKFPISKPYCKINKNHLTQGLLLAAVDKHNRLVLYALTIVNNGVYNDFKDTTIRLEMCVGGKEWMTLLRLDNNGSPHPNYIENGKLVSDSKDIKIIESPHLHRNCHEAEVLAHKFKDYTPAEEIAEPVRDLKEALDYFLKKANINVKINPSLIGQANYYFNFNQSLFDPDDIANGNNKFATKYYEILENFGAKECS